MDRGFYSIGACVYNSNDELVKSFRWTYVTDVEWLGTMRVERSSPSAVECAKGYARLLNGVGPRTEKARREVQGTPSRR